MFIFHRTRRGQTEVFDVLVAEGGLPDAEDRFGAALRHDLHDERFHSVGQLVLIHDEKETEYFLMWKSELGESEYARLLREIEHLCDAEVHAFGSEPTIGWYARDVLRDSARTPTKQPE